MTTKEAIQNPSTTFIDIREQYELDEYGFLENAKHIPMGEIPEKVDQIKNLPKPIVFFCRSGGRASKVLEFLHSQEVDDIFNGGGYEDVKQILEETS